MGYGCAHNARMTLQSAAVRIRDRVLTSLHLKRRSLQRVRRDDQCARAIGFRAIYNPQPHDLQARVYLAVAVVEGTQQRAVILSMPSMRPMHDWKRATSHKAFKGFVRDVVMTSHVDAAGIRRATPDVARSEQPRGRFQMERYIIEMLEASGMPVIAARIVPHHRLQLNSYVGPDPFDETFTRRDVDLSEYGENAQAAILSAISALPEE